MLLAIDVGNTQTAFGLFEGERLTEQFRVGTDRSDTSDELAVMLRAFVDLSSLDGIVLCASVPTLVREYEAFAERWAARSCWCSDRASRRECRSATTTRARWGRTGSRTPSRCANGTARRRSSSTSARRRTSTSSTRRASSQAVCSRLGSRSRWTRCSPARRGSRRSRSPRPSAVISQTTVAAAPVGPRLRLRRAGGRDRRRGSWASWAPRAHRSLATGGLADLIAPHSATISAVDLELTLHGLRLVWERNRAIG